MAEEADPQAEKEIETQEPAEEETPPIAEEAAAEKPPEGEKPAEKETPPEEDRELTPSEQEDQDAEKPLEEKLADMFWGVYNNKYYMDVLKATAIFLVALKIASELKKISIPLKDYQPFQFQRVCSCGKY